MLLKRITFLPALVLVIGFAGCRSSQLVVETTPPEQVSNANPLDYRVNLAERDDDLFDVTLFVSDLSEANAVYQFASTAPGSYEVMDIGRYVSSFTAFDGGGSPIPVVRASTNQWRITAPDRVARIEYSVADTWDAEVEGHPVMLMGGTSMEADHVLFNSNAVLGFPTGMQKRPLRIQLEYPSDWTVGTALNVDDEGRYLADNYDHVVDSPILLGPLTHASLEVRGGQIDIYTYSATGKVTSQMVLEATRDILDAAGDFLRELPVDRYTFLFHFGDPLAQKANDRGYVGAWEHSYSSEYILDEATFEADLQDQIPNFIAHEFFHVVTPLNIHSEIIETFNFVTPVPSEHLWLYEGVTEWVAQTMQLRAGMIDVDEYLNRMSRKLETNDTFDKSMSLTQLSMEAYSDRGQDQYPNIYERGAVVAALLDLRLLQLSGGTRGLREVLLELAQDYGPDRAFDDATFFDTFASLTYPEIRDFFDRYVRGVEDLPVEEYFSKVGVRYVDEIETGYMIPDLGFEIGVPDGQIRIIETSTHSEECGFREDDVIVGIDGESLTFSSAQSLFTSLGQLDADVPYRMTVMRGEVERSIQCRKELKEYIAHHVFGVDPAPTSDQLRLREAWITNLD